MRRRAGIIPGPSAFFLQNSHGRLRPNHAYPCLHPFFLAQYPVPSTASRSQPAYSGFVTIGFILRLAGVICSRETLGECAAT